MCSELEAAVYGLAATNAVTLALWLYNRWLFGRQRALTLVVIGRALSALNNRGVKRAKALAQIAPELRDAVNRRSHR